MLFVPGELIIQRSRCCSFAGYILKASVLPFMACPSPLVAEPLRKIKVILEALSSTSVAPAPAELVAHSSPLAHLCIRSYTFSVDWNSDTLFKWLKMVKNSPQQFQLQCALILGAFLISPDNNLPALPLCLDVLVDLARSTPELIASVLTWLLSRLSQEKRPQCQLALLKALPRLGKQKASCRKR